MIRVVDLRDLDATRSLFTRYGKDVDVIIHAAAQPSHDWAARDPHTDFTVNANATLNLLELTREHCPDAVFVYMSTNKVYGDTPNRLPLVETETRFEIEDSHPYHRGIDESMSIDHCMHSLFGVSKTAAVLPSSTSARQNQRVNGPLVPWPLNAPSVAAEPPMSHFIVGIAFLPLMLSPPVS